MRGDYMLGVLDVVTLDNNKDYIVLNVTKLNDINYVSLVGQNDQNDFKLLEETLKDGEIILKEVSDEIIIEKLRLQVLKESANLLKEIKKNNK